MKYASMSTPRDFYGDNNSFLPFKTMYPSSAFLSFIFPYSWCTNHHHYSNYLQLNHNTPALHQPFMEPSWLCKLKGKHIFKFQKPVDAVSLLKHVWQLISNSPSLALVDNQLVWSTFRPSAPSMSNCIIYSISDKWWCIQPYSVGRTPCNFCTAAVTSPKQKKELPAL